MLEIVGEIVLEIACGITGHVVLWTVTLGSWKPFTERDDVADVAGILFWVAVAVGAWFVFG